MIASAARVLKSISPSGEFASGSPQLPSTKQAPDTLPKAQLLASGDMRADVIVIGSGPTGLACTIEAQKAGFKVICIDKG